MHEMTPPPGATAPVFYEQEEHAHGVDSAVRTGSEVALLTGEPYWSKPALVCPAPRARLQEDRDLAALCYEFFCPANNYWPLDEAPRHRELWRARRGDLPGVR